MKLTRNSGTTSTITNMTSGAVVMPFLGRDCIMLSTFDNKAFLSELKKRIQTLDQPWAMVNSMAITLSINSFCDFVKEHNWRKREKDFCSSAMALSANYYGILKQVGQQECKLKPLKDALERMITVLEDGLDVETPGIDQNIVRLMLMVRFEDPLVSPDFFSLYADDFGTNDGSYGIE